MQLSYGLYTNILKIFTLHIPSRTAASYQYPPTQQRDPNRVAVAHPCYGNSAAIQPATCMQVFYDAPNITQNQPHSGFNPTYFSFFLNPRLTPLMQ